MARLPFMNSGSYKWIPDDFGSTSEADFGVTRAFYAAVIDYGRPHNVLPEGTGGHASGTNIWGNKVRISKKGTLVPGTITDATAPLPVPFYRSLMRSLSTTLDTLPDPGDEEGIGLSSLDYDPTDPPFILFTVDDIGNGKTASLLIDYALLTSTNYEEVAGNATPVSIVALFDPNTVGDWYDLSRTTGDGGYWGPASAETPVTGVTIDRAKSLLGLPSLVGVHVPLPFRDASGAGTSISEFVITHSGEYGPGQQQPWGVTSTRTVSIRLCRRYFTASDYFPRLKAILIMPNEQAITNDGKTAYGLASIPDWNFMVSRIRYYDALQTNVVPEHTEQDGDTTIVVEPQFPCTIFGYAWRVSHPVQMSKNTPVIQPSIGTVMPKLGPDLGASGYAMRTGTFKFKLYHPDVEGVGVAHSVRFYYGLAVMAIPGTAPGFNSSLIGVMTSLLVDFDLLLVQYMGPLVGHQSLTFVPSTNQMHEAELGLIANGGIYGYSRQTVALKCFRGIGSGSTPPNAPIPGNPGTWVDVETAKFPASDRTGVKPLWYDEGGNRNSWYTFLSLDAHGVTSWNPNVAAAYAGGFSVVDRGGPQTHVPGKGAFSMTTTTSSSGFGGIERTTAYAKVKSVPFNYSLNVGAWADADSHLATFVSDVRNIGSSARIFTGNWRLQFAAWVDDTARHSVQVFYRFAFVDASVPDEMLNGSTLWTYGPDKVQEFHFSPSTGGTRIASGPPLPSSVLSSPVLSTQPMTYPLTWFCEGAFGGDAVFSDDNDSSLLERTITANLQFGDVRIAVQAWAIAYAVPGAPLGDRDVDTWYPTTSFAWGGDVESMFQTMITEAKSGAIFAQQDPIVESYQPERKDEITMLDKGAYSDGQLSGAPFRDRPLYNNVMDVSGTERFNPGTSEQNPKIDDNTVYLASTDVMVPGGVSLTGIAPREYYDPLDDSAQVADRYVSINSGTDAVLGGTFVRSQTIAVTGTMYTNKSTFDARVVFSLWLINAEETVAYLLAKSGQAYTGRGASALDQGATDFATVMDIGQDMVVPDARAKLMLRIQVWAYYNNYKDVIIPDTEAEGFEEGFISIDIENLKMSFEVGLECISNESYLLGSNNWYQNLPVSTARTFGSSDYYFVADYDSVTTTVMPPLTMSNYGYWYLWGWMFSPFWFVEMPDGGVFEIQDRAGLTLGNAVTGTNFVGAERAQRVVRVRTAIDTLPSSGVSAARGSINFGDTGFVARASIENTGDPTGGNTLGVLQIQNEVMLKGLVEWAVRADETIITGKNPLIVTLDPTAEWLRHLGLVYSKAKPQVRLLFYEEDTFDSAAHQASIAMLANYDGTCQNWRNPYGEAGSGGIARVVMTNDMEMLGACVDPRTYSVYVVGFRTTDRESPQDGGSIVLRELQPLLVFGTDSAATGPLHYVDGTLTDESWNTSSILQPLLPNTTTEGWTASGSPGNVADAIMEARGNRLGANRATLPAAYGFPDCFCDYMGNVYVFYSLQADMSTEGPRQLGGTLGKVFCRRTQNCGYYFERPFPVADLGYAAACNELSCSPPVLQFEDDSFQVRHITAMYDDQHSLSVVFFWAGGKVFMRYGIDPAPAADRAESASQGPFDFADPLHRIVGGGNQIYMVAGSTDFLEQGPASALDSWLNAQWMMAGGAASEPESGMSDGHEGWFADEYGAWDVSGDKLNNFGLSEGGSTTPSILINRFDNDPDVPPQRVAAFVTQNGEIVLLFTDSLHQLMYKRIRLSGRYPVISPAVHFATNVK